MKSSKSLYKKRELEILTEESNDLTVSFNPQTQDVFEHTETPSF
jgi:hypothetical protein